MQNTTVQARTKVHTRVKAEQQAQAEISRGAMFVVTSVPTLVGVWAASCFAGGLLMAGGPVSMVQAFFRALTGL